MKLEIRISGLGGQGVVLAGQILGCAAVFDGKQVVQTQSYGAEARGSAAKSEVIVSDEKIGFPMVRKCDILVALSQSALDKHVKDLKTNAFLLVDSGNVKEIPEIRGEVERAQITEVAERELKSKLFANVVMLGILVKATKVVSVDSMEKALKTVIRPDMVEPNLLAFRKGYEYSKK